MSTFLSLSDDDIELLNRQFGLKLTREEWNRRLTTTPTFASLVRSYFDWHISELAALAAGDDRLPAGINAIDAPFPPTARGASEPDARLRAARFMLETIRPIPEDGEAREKRISLLTEPLHSGALPDAAFVRRVLYLASRWYHRPDQMDAEGALMLRKYLLRVSARVRGRTRHHQAHPPLAHLRIRDRYRHGQLHAQLTFCRNPSDRALAPLHIGYMAVLAANNSVFIGHSSRLFVR
ncbi:MAG: hypothetical protein ACLUNV_08625 [Sutterella wadsworthensis]